MARKPRWWLPGRGAHLISRFVDRKFHIADAKDRKAYLDAMSRAQSRWDWRWLSFALMSSHVHHGLAAGTTNPGQFYRSAHTRYAAHFHRRRGEATSGPVFSSRPKYYPVEPAQLLKMVAYHHQNPVNAGVVARASESNWTSHRYYLRLEPAPPWLDIEWALDLFGFSDTAAGRVRFDEFVMDFEPAFGDSKPEDRPEPVHELPVPDNVDWVQLICAARNIANVPIGQSIASRKRSSVLARVLIGRIATEELGLPCSALAPHVGMCPGAVSNLLARASSRSSSTEEHLRELRWKLFPDLPKPSTER